MEALKNLSAEIVDQKELKLREECKSWSPQQWESYLQSIECPRHEELVSPKRYDRIAEETIGSIFDSAQLHASPDLQAHVRAAIDSLTTQQRKVVELIFYKSKSCRDVAKELGIGLATVRDLKKKGLKNLRLHFEGGHTDSVLVEGQFFETEPISE